MQAVILPYETIILMPRKEFWAEARNKLRPHALSAVVEFGQYLMLWALVAGAHLVRLGMELIGIDPQLVFIVALLEKWVFIASFASFFWRIIIRLYNSARGLDS